MRPPLFYLPRVVANLQKQGVENEVPLKTFRNEYMEITGVLNKKTVDRWIECLVDLGYLRFNNADILSFTVKMKKNIIKPLEEKEDGKK